MQLIFKYQNGKECWLVAGDYYLYGVTLSGDPRICPSEGMARELAA